MIKEAKKHIKLGHIYDKKRNNKTLRKQEQKEYLLTLHL